MMGGIRMLLNKKEQASIALLKLLSDDRRFLACKLLARSKKGLTVGDLALALEVTHSAASHLLGKLHDAKIVLYERDGREMYYALAQTPEAKRLIQVLKTLA